MTKPAANRKCRPPLKPLKKFTEARMERDGSGIPAKTPFFFAHVQTVQECESPVSPGWQEPVCSFLGGGAGGGELANCRACSG